MRTPKFHYYWAVTLVEDIAHNHTATQSVDGDFRTFEEAEAAGRIAQKKWPAFNRLTFRRWRNYKSAAQLGRNRNLPTVDPKIPIQHIK